MNGYELELALKKVVGESTDDRWDEYWDEYTGVNGFYHLIAGVSYVDTKLDFVKKGDTVTVPGLGDFTKVETYDDNFDRYESTADTYLVFEHNGNHYRVEGHLDSHHGGVWDGGLEQVKPVEKTVTVWERA